MPEAIAEAPAPNAGISTLIGMFDEDAPIAPETTPAPEPVKEVKPEKAKEKEQPKVEAPKVEAKTPPKVEPKKEDNHSLRSELKKANEAAAAARKEIEARDAKLKEIESKRFWSEDDEKKMSAHEKRIAELQQQLTESAYERSDEYRRQFAEPWQRTWQSIAKMVDGMTIQDAEGNSRKATLADFNRVYNADPADQTTEANKFGPHAARVLSQLDKLGDIREQEARALAEHKTKLETKTKLEQETRSQEQKMFETSRSKALEQIKTEHAAIFAPNPDDPDFSEKLQKGYDYMDTMQAKIADMSVEEKAAFSAVVYARSAALNASEFRAKRAEAKAKELQAALDKLRGTDPGAAGERDGSAPAKEGEGVPTGGIEALTAESAWA